MTVPANVAAAFGTWSGVVCIRPPLVCVRMDGRAEPRLALDWIECRMGAAPRARFSAGFGRSVSGDNLRLEQMAARIVPGRTVTATLLRGGVMPGASRGDLVLFEGRIGRLDMRLDSAGEELSFEAEDLSGELLRRRIGGRRTWAADGQAVRIEGLPLVFNPGGRPNASPQAFDPETGGSYQVFAPDERGDSAPWTLAEAAAYLLAEHGLGASAGVPGPAEARAALPALDIRDVSLEGRTLGEAMEALLELAGARLVIAAEPAAAGVRRRVEIWYPSRAPVAYLSHQQPGAAYSPAGTQFHAARMTMHFDTSPRRYVARGDARLYESTFDLVHGWDDALATYEPDDFAPSTNPDFALVRDVFRKWALNEDGRYTAAPYNRGPAPDLSALFDGAAYARRRRRLLPCLSRDSLGRSRGVFVEVSLDAGATWRPAGMTVRIPADEAALYFGDETLPPAYLAAAMRGDVRVRATATLESDDRLTVSWPDEDAPERPGRTRHVSAPAGYRFRRVAPTSRFFGQGGADEVDDTPRLQELVQAAWQSDRRTPAPGRIEVPYLALAYRVGHRIAGIRGRRIDLVRRHEGYCSAPVVVRIRHVFAPAPLTELELE